MPHDHDHLSCKEFFEFMMAYCDQELSAAVREKFAEHMKLCPPCGDYLDSYKDSVKLSRACCHEHAAEKVPAPPEELVQAILAARKADVGSGDFEA